MDPDSKPDPDPEYDHVIQDFDMLNKLKVSAFFIVFVYFYSEI